MDKTLRIVEEVSIKINDLINNTAIEELIKVSSHSSEQSNFILITNSRDEVRIKYSYATGQKIQLIDEILHFFISLGNLELENIASDGEISIKKIPQLKKHLIHEDYLIKVINFEKLDNKTTLLVDLINDNNFWKDKFFYLDYMPFVGNLNNDGSVKLYNLNLFQLDVVDKINKGNYKTIIIDKMWLLSAPSNGYRKNDLLEKLNELCENQDLEILITYEKFRSSNSFYELHLYPNLQKIVNANMQ